MSEANILIVDDNPGMIQLLGRLLSDLGETRFATNGRAALKAMSQAAPDIVLLDAEMPGVDGFEVCKLIKADPDFRDIPVIVVTAHNGTDFELAGFQAGACDFVAKPVSEQLLLARVKTHLRLKSLADELRGISKVDPMTKLASRSHFEDILDREWRRGLRFGHPIATAMFEIDHFDLLIERHGRRAGDECLLAVAQAVRDIGSRPEDLTARFDHHVFAMLLPNTTRVDAEHAARRVIDAVEALAIAHAASTISNHVTVSAGIGCYDEQSPGWNGPTGTSAFIPDEQTVRRPRHLQESALLAIEAARRGGRSQAWWLDAANSEKPELAREIQPAVLATA